ncbi:MAG: zinc-dependent peptidase [Burkholderiales bacterium]|jgi:Mlc titration factor MtfA (ptsG expression regulator)|nr:zinc-dependent peptidase [Betaproteobacteria bacterium]
MSLLRKLTAWVKKPVPVIDESLWREATAGYAFMHGLTLEENRRLRLVASDFLAQKSIVGTADMPVTDKMRVEIAAQASILVLELGIDYFSGWSDIIVYPGQFRPEREVIDDIGLVHTTRETLAGEAWLGGPIILSYEDVARVGSADAVAGHNVVIHEFAHKLDMLNGDANGFPPLHKTMSNKHWQLVFQAAYLDFCAKTDEADGAVPDDGGAAISVLPMDRYASQSPAEFFAVVSEAFFELPQQIKRAYPEVYAQLALFYRQDPAARQTRKL